MQSVQQLIDRNGVPPKEICLDWAWQLNEHASTTDRSLLTNWASIEVGDQGMLIIRSEATTTESAISCSLPELIGQLLHWAAGDPSSSELAYCEAPSDSAPIVDAVAQLPEAISADIPAVTIPAGIPSGGIPSGTQHLLHSMTVRALEGPAPRDLAAGESISGHLTSSASISGDSTEKFGSVAVSPNSNSSIASGRRSLHKKGKNSLKVRAVLAGSALACITLAIVFYAWVQDSPADTSNLLASSNAKQTAQPSGSASATRGSNKQTQPGAPKQANSELDALLQGTSSEPNSSTLENLPTSSSLDVPASSPVHPIEKLALPDIAGQASTSAFSDQTSSDSASSNPPSSDGTTASSSTISSSADSPATKTTDLAADMTKNEVIAEHEGQQSVVELLSSIAQMEPKNSDLEDLPNSLSDAMQIQAQNLDLDSFTQVQRVPTRFRVREPVWQLRLETTESMLIEPSEAQRIESKQSARWVIKAKDVKARKGQTVTQAVVLAQLTGRRADIRWTMAAGSPDTPGFMVPLNSDKLDQMSDYLQDYKQKLSNQLAGVKNDLDSPVLPRELKAVLYARKKFLDNESKVSQRVGQIIADASLMVGWMDKTIKVHGQLTDQVGATPEVLVIMGELAKAKEDSTSESSAESTP